MRLVQSIDYAAIAPPVIVALAAIGVLGIDLFAPARRRRIAPLAVAGTLAALGVTVWLATGPARRTFCFPGGSCSYVVDDYALFFQVLFLAATLVVLLLSTPVVDEESLPTGEYHALLLFSVSGMLTLASGRDLVTLLVALEVVSLPAFVLVGLRRSDARAAEGALKFFLFSVISTAITAYGMALAYGVTGSVSLDRIAAALTRVHAHGGAMSATAAAASVLVVVGFAFKVAAVPFHFWVPDTYQGAPVPVAAFLSVASKAAGFAGLLVILLDGFRPYADIWGPVLAVLAAVTMTVGNLVALRQWNVVRLLAWSTVAQAGYLLVPLGVAATAHGRDPALLHEAGQATLAYLGIFAAMNLGAFSCVAVVARRSPRRAIADYRGLARRMPAVAVAFAVFLTALAGLPPGVAGLFAKVVVLRTAVHGDVAWLAVIAAVNTVVGLAYYLRVAAVMFVVDEEAPELPVSPRPSRGIAIAVAVTAVVTVALSVDPQPLLHAAGLASR
jgi:NADH-quinone oxidoreductase subunit N